MGVSFFKVIFNQNVSPFDEPYWISRPSIMAAILSLFLSNSPCLYSIHLLLPSSGGNMLHHSLFRLYLPLVSDPRISANRHAWIASRTQLGHTR